VPSTLKTFPRRVTGPTPCSTRLHEPVDVRLHVAEQLSEPAHLRRRHAVLGQALDGLLDGQLRETLLDSRHMPLSGGQLGGAGRRRLRIL
jgi:hypothetical protein